METRGRHLVVELDGCDPWVLGDGVRIRDALLEAACQARATVLSDHFYDFPTGGVSGVVVLAESHISIHTWPEHRYAAVDVYTCGSYAMPEVACVALRRYLKARHARVTGLDRGIPRGDGTHDTKVQESLTYLLRAAS